jgi:hypothetical protein
MPSRVMIQKVGSFTKCEVKLSYAGFVSVMKEYRGVKVELNSLRTSTVRRRWVVKFQVQAALHPEKKLSLQSHSKAYNPQEFFYPGKFFVKNVKLQLVVFMEIDANRNNCRKKEANVNRLNAIHLCNLSL